MLIIKKIKYKDYLYEWLINKKSFIKESTYANYSNIVFSYITPKLGNYYLNELNNKIIQDYILYLHNTKNLSVKTIKDIIMIVKESIKCAVNNNVIKSFDLKFSYPKNNITNHMYVLTKREQNILMEYVLNNINNKSIGILMSLLLGIRIGELCALKWEDIDFKRKILHVNKTVQRIYIKDINNNISKVIISLPKTNNSNRDIPINKELLDILKTLKTNKEDYVLTRNNKNTEPRVYRSYFNTILKKNNIKHIKFHSLRHTFATNCISLGIDYKTVSELLGHSNINTTLNLYVHPRLSQKKKCISKLYKNVIK